jgi:hypothetical protein
MREERAVKKIGKRNWKRSYKRWNPDNPKRGDEPDCGYCSHNTKYEEDNCDNCCLGSKKLCFYYAGGPRGQKTAWGKWLKAQTMKTKTKYANIIFEAICAHGRELGYLDD